MPRSCACTIAKLTPCFLKKVRSKTRCPLLAFLSSELRRLARNGLHGSPLYLLSFFRTCTARVQQCFCHSEPVGISNPAQVKQSVPNVAFFTETAGDDLDFFGLSEFNMSRKTQSIGCAI